MRNVNYNVLSAADNVNTTGGKVDSNQLVSASFHAYFGDANAAGTFKLQASNDPSTVRNLPADFTPTNWVDIPNQSAVIVAGASALLTITASAYRWLRAVYTNTATWVQSQTITTVADVTGSLNSTFFLLSSINTVTGVQKNFYVWFNINGAGVDPAVSGRTGVQIVGATDASANTLATAIRAALNLLTGDFVATGATNAVIVTNVNPGPVTAAVDGSAATGFGFGSATPGITPTTVNINMNAIGV